MAENEFLLRIIGEDVAPRHIDVEDLSWVIRGFRGAIASVASSRGKDEDDVFLSLVGLTSSVTNRSTLTLFGSPESLTSAKRLLSALSTDKGDSLPDRAKQHLRDVWKAVFYNGWDACEFEGNGSHIGHAAILKDRELFPEPLTFRGLTEVYGRCLRAGGETRRTAQIRLLDGSLIYVRLKTRELAETLGTRLYQIVGLRGEAIWSGPERNLSKFRADELLPFVDRQPAMSPQHKPLERSIVESFDALSKAAGTRWDDVDPEEFVAEQRRD